MNRAIDFLLESARMLGFLTIVAFSTLAFAPLVGCDQKSGGSDSSAPSGSDVPGERGIKVNAPGVDIEIDRSPPGDGRPDVDVNVRPGIGPGVDVEVDRDPAAGPRVDVDVDPR